MLQKQIKQVKNRSTRIINIGVKDNFTEEKAIILTLNEYNQLKESSNTNNDTQITTLNVKCEYLEKTIQDKEQLNQELKEINKELNNKLDKLHQEINLLKESYIKELINKEKELNNKNNEFTYILSDIKSLTKIELLFNKHKQIIKEFERDNKEKITPLNNKLVKE